MIIDIHAHYIPQLVFDRFEREASKFPGVALTRDDKGVRIGFVGKDLSRPIMPKLSALADRRAWMDANGIDHQLVGAWMDATGYELPPEQGLAWSRFMNACTLENLGDEPGLFCDFSNGGLFTCFVALGVTLRNTPVDSPTAI